MTARIHPLPLHAARSTQPVWVDTTADAMASARRAGLAEGERKGYIAGWRWGLVCGATLGITAGSLLIVGALFIGRLVGSGALAWLAALGA